MPQLDAIQSALREFIYTQFPTARNRALGDEDSLLDQSVIDSMGVLEIVTFIENQFDVVLTDDDLLSDHFDSIRSMAALVYQKLLEGAAWTT